ncbi:hypothetical protein [Rhizobium sp. MHM7A]|uniref:hypothetical protein n=1 Tax=Rhizobium sp. MHM7A TaxID=2583233 RepID=UPI0011059318|nr:hypothetical protein [Rhizobium sp. MHM7A]TLX17154.1 hypothetical protein FFR93_07545 [Rhizobium sp. MHM7A]
MTEIKLGLDIDTFAGALILVSNRTLSDSEIMKDTSAVYGSVEIFAMDVFADVFALHRDRVIRIGTETGDVAEEWPSPSAWETDMINDRRAVGQTFLKMWEDANGKLPDGHRLTPKMQIVFGGEFTIENMVSMPVQTILDFRTDIVRQIRGLPDGARIMLDTQ